MEWLDAHLAFVSRHLYALVFGAFLIEGAGMPLPSRILLIVAASLVDDLRGLALLAATCLCGAILGDHLPFLGGRLAGTRILSVYCRVTLGSQQCVEKTIGYFVRFGAAAILLSRFSTSVRIFAAALSGCGHISYPRFVAFDFVGTALYAVLWVTIGYVLGAPAVDLLKRFRALNLLLLLGPAALLTLLGYRLWRRMRYGAAPSLTEGDVAERTRLACEPVVGGRR
jgi:membrane protein DedA with SNARE-associated domain